MDLIISLGKFAALFALGAGVSFFSGHFVLIALVGSGASWSKLKQRIFLTLSGAIVLAGGFLCWFVPAFLWPMGVGFTTFPLFMSCLFVTKHLYGKQNREMEILARRKQLQVCVVDDNCPNDDGLLHLYLEHIEHWLDQKMGVRGLMLGSIIFSFVGFLLLPFTAFVLPLTGKRIV